MQPIFDMHCHYGFAPDPEKLMCEAAELGVGAFSCGVEPLQGVPRADSAATGTVQWTVPPSEDCLSTEPPAGAQLVVDGLGLHPWWIADGRCGQADVDRFVELAGQTPFIGEIGLDFGKKCLSHEGSQERQIAAFEAVLKSCEGERKLMSVHAVKSAGAILGLLAKSAQGHDVIFHWFSGTSQELQAAIEAGCYFSINPHMLETKRGREYARIIPTNQLLLETDAPSDEGMPYSGAQQRAELDAALLRLAEIRGISADELGETIAATSLRLLSR